MSDLVESSPIDLAIVKELVTKTKLHLIGVVGFMGSGKDTVADMLQRYDYSRTSFASTLKDATSIIFGWDRTMVEGMTKESRAWREVPDVYWSRKFGRDFTPREALQKMGTEAGRNVFHHNLWADSTEQRILKHRDTDAKRGVDTKIVITDVRFLNEIEMIHRIGGLIVRIKRGSEPAHFEAAAAYNFDRLLTGKMDKPIEDELLKKVHPSEWDWIGSPLIEYELDNNGPMSALQEQVFKLKEYVANHNLEGI